MAVSLAGLELIDAPGRRVPQPPAPRRRRRRPCREFKVSAGPAPSRPRQRRPRLFFEPPAEWGWNFLGKPPRLPLDPSAQADCLQALSEIEASDFAPGPPFDPERDPRAPDGNGQRLPTGNPHPVREGRGRHARVRAAGRCARRPRAVRSSSVAFLAKPYWELLARQAYSAGWFSLHAIEVEEVGKRKVVVDAQNTGGAEPDFVLVEPAPPTRRRVPREVVNPVTDKLSLLTVDSFAGHGAPETYGLDKPQYIIRWRDSGKSQGVPVDQKDGQLAGVEDRGPRSRWPASRRARRAARPDHEDRLAGSRSLPQPARVGGPVGLTSRG